MTPIEETIDGVERLYRTVTGQPAPSADEAYAPIPAERNPAEYVDQQIERLAGLLASTAAFPHPQLARTPAMSVWENEQELIIYVELPGVGRDRLHVQAVGRLIHVHGHRSRPERLGACLTLAESAPGPFYRTIGMPAHARVEGLNARLTEGLLEIRVPKSRSDVNSARDVPVL